MLLDHHVNTMFLHDRFFEPSSGADVDQSNSPSADPKRLTKKLLTFPNETIADLDAYGLSLNAHAPVDTRTPVVGFLDAGTTRFASTLVYPR